MSDSTNRLRQLLFIFNERMSLSTWAVRMSLSTWAVRMSASTYTKRPGLFETIIGIHVRASIYAVRALTADKEPVSIVLDVKLSLRFLEAVKIALKTSDAPTDTLRVRLALIDTLSFSLPETCADM
jgi:hypothetical protein